MKITNLKDFKIYEARRQILKDRHIKESLSKGINESRNNERWLYSWGGTFSATIYFRSGIYKWIVEEENEAIPTFMVSDHAEILTPEEAEDDMFTEIENRIGHTPKRQIKLNESLSKGRESEAKIKILVDEAKAMIDAKMKLKEIGELRKIKNNELKEALEELKQTSIIAKDVLFEVIKPYERSGLNTKDYIKFVEESTDEITKEFKSIHELALKLAKKDKVGYVYFRTAKNKDNLPAGTIVESRLSKIKDWVKGIFKSIKDKIKGFKSKLTNISDKAKEFQTVKVDENKFTSGFIPGDMIVQKNPRYIVVSNNGKEYTIADNGERRERIIIDGNLKHGKNIKADLSLDELEETNEKYEGNKSKFKDAIIDLLTENKELNYTECIDMISKKLGYDHNIDLSVYRNLMQLLEQGILSRAKKSGRGKAYFYTLVNETDGVDLIDDDPTVNVEPDNDAIVALLEQANEAIKLAEEEKYYQALVDSKEETVLKMMHEFGATKMAIGDKILSIVDVKPGVTTDWNKYQEVILEAKTVSTGTKTMAKQLFDTYTKVSQVSGSIRQFDNDADLPTGTLGATFDYVLKKVIPKEGIPTNESVLDIIKKVGNQIKLIFFRFFKTNKKVNDALNKI